MLVSAFAGVRHHPRGLRPRHRRTLPLLQLWRRDVSGKNAQPNEIRPPHHRRRRTPRPAPSRARHRADAGIHAGGHLRHGEGDVAVRTHRNRLRDGAVQHLPPVAAPGAGRDRTIRRAAPLHGLGQAHPHRFGRFPGVQPGQAAQDHRGRREVRLADQRRQAVSDAGNLDADPAHAEFRHRDDFRRMHALPRHRTRGRRFDADEPALGRALQGRARRQSQRAVWHRAGRHVRDAARRIDARTDRHGLRRLRHRRPERWANPRTT